MSPAANCGPPTSGLSPLNWRLTPASHRHTDLKASIPIVDAHQVAECRPRSRDLHLRCGVSAHRVGFAAEGLMKRHLTTFFAVAMLGCAGHAWAQKPQPTVLTNAQLKALLSKGLTVKITGADRPNT